MLTRASVWVKEAVTKGHVVCGPVRVQRPPGGTRKAEGGSRTPKPGVGVGQTVMAVEHSRIRCWWRLHNYVTIPPPRDREHLKDRFYC